MNFRLTFNLSIKARLYLRLLKSSTVSELIFLLSCEIVCEHLGFTPFKDRMYCTIRQALRINSEFISKNT